MSKSEKKLTVSVFIIRMISLSIACFLLLGLAVYTIRLDSVTSVLSKSGSRGEEVRWGTDQKSGSCISEEERPKPGWNRRPGYLKGTGNLQLPADGRERRLFQQ